MRPMSRPLARTQCVAGCLCLRHLLVVLNAGLLQLLGHIRLGVLLLLQFGSCGDGTTIHGLVLSRGLTSEVGGASLFSL